MDKTRDIKWAAGLWEGEGHASMQIRSERRNVNKNWSKARTMQMAMTDLEPLQWFMEIVRVGTIKPIHHKTGLHKKPVWVWQCRAYFDILHVAMQLYPYLSPRRQAQLEEATLIGETGRGRGGYKPLVLHPLGV